jgi:arylsulfatase A-like enzyme
MPYEGLLRVGCIVQGPGVPAGQLVEAPVSTLDIPATVLDYAGVSPERPLHSRSLRPLIEDPGADRDFANSEWDLSPSRCGVELQLRTVRTKAYKLTLELVSGAGELYDLVNDPYEMDNRFDDPALGNVQRDLVGMIRSRPDDAIEPPLAPVGMA